MKSIILGLFMLVLLSYLLFLVVRDDKNKVHLPYYSTPLQDCPSTTIQ